MSESSATPESPAFLVVAPFFSLTWSGNRPRLVAEALAGLGAVDLVTGDFDHQRKSRRPAESWSVVRRIVQLPTPAYRSNVSVRRFVSHLVLSIRAARYVRANAARYTAVYVSAPIALLAAWAFASGSVRLRILDVVDVWPDSLPFPRWLRLLGWPGFDSGGGASRSPAAVPMSSSRCRTSALPTGFGISKGRRRERRASTRVTTRCPALTLPVRRSSPSFTSATSGGCTTSTPCSPRCRSNGDDGSYSSWARGTGARGCWRSCRAGPPA